MKLRVLFKKFLKRLLRFLETKKYVTVVITRLPKNQWLKGRKALITGGTSGIGYEIACSFIDSGASVIITGRSQEKIDVICNKIIKEKNCVHRIMGIQMDNSSVKDINNKIPKAIEMMKGIDILVNNAGVHGGHISSVTEEDYDIIMDTNLKGVVFISKIIAKYMKENKIQGNILNIASSSSVRPADSAYSLSKWGIRGFTEGMARTLSPYGIVVNGIAPGPTATPMLLKDDKESNVSWPLNLTGRMATTCEIANFATILVSNMGRMIVGDIIYMSGGGGIITNEDVVFHF